MKAKAWIGIDPGASGAIAILGSESVIYANDHLDISSSSTWLFEWNCEFDIQMALLERVSAMPKQGVSSTFKFGINYGTWQGLLTALRISWMLVSPKDWQKGLVCKTDGADSKERSLNVARRMFPDVDLHRKKDHDKADALLIAYYARSLSIK